MNLEELKKAQEELNKQIEEAEKAKKTVKKESNVASPIDWLTAKESVDNEGNVTKTYSISHYTEALEERIINELNLIKFNGIVFQDGKNMVEKLSDQVFRIMRNEAKGLYPIQMKHADEIAKRVVATLKSPKDDRNLITFNNKTINYLETRSKGELVFTENKIENHNPVKWDYMTIEEINASPKHKEMKDFMFEMINGWRIDSKLFFKIAAYTMIKHNFADKVFYFKGESGRGKSTALDMIKSLYYESASKPYNPINPTLGSETSFVGSQIVYLSDLIDGAQDITHIRPAATGDDIDIRPLYQNPTSYKPYATMIFGTNFEVEWKGRSGGTNAADDRVFIIEFRGEKFRGSEKAKKFKDIDPLNNKYFMDVFASYAARAIPLVIEEEFNDEESVSMKSDYVSENDVIYSFIRFIKDDGGKQIFYPSRDEVIALGLQRDRYTTSNELWSYFKAWREDAEYKGRPNSEEFKKQFEQLTKIKIKNVEKHTPEAGMVQGRWIDLKTIIEIEKEEIKETEVKNDPMVVFPEVEERKW